jgi:Fe2+ transport system protein FeoA
MLRRSQPCGRRSQPAANLLAACTPVTDPGVAARPSAAPAAALSLADASGPCTVLAVDGGDELAHRLVAAGLWPGTQVVRLTAAPFGDPLLFLVHGYRLALRRSEAARVAVTLQAPTGASA